VKPSQGVKEFPNEGLKELVGGKLFCTACLETLCVKKSSIFKPYWFFKECGGKEKNGG